MHKAVCDDCGRKCEVPFKPTSGKPIYCSDCFEKDDDDFGRRDDSRWRRDNYSRRDNDRGWRDYDRWWRDSRETRMHKAVCDECGIKCEVPFKPTQGKPIYCSDCFSKDKDNDSYSNKSSYSSKESKNQYQEEFETINDKLDRILKILSNKNRKEELEFLRTWDASKLEENKDLEVSLAISEEVVKEAPKKKVAKKTTTKKETTKKEEKKPAKKAPAKKAAASKKPTAKKEAKKPAAKKKTKAK